MLADDYVPQLITTKPINQHQDFHHGCSQLFLLCLYWLIFQTLAIIKFTCMMYGFLYLYLMVSRSSFKLTFETFLMIDFSRFFLKVIF